MTFSMAAAKAAAPAPPCFFVRGGGNEGSE